MIALKILKQKFQINTTIPINPITTGKKWIELVAQIIKENRLLPYDKKVMIDFTWIEPDTTRDKAALSSSGRDIILQALKKSAIISTDTWRGLIGFRDHYITRDYDFGVLVYLDDFDPISTNGKKKVRSNGTSLATN